MYRSLYFSIHRNNCLHKGNYLFIDIKNIGQFSITLCQFMMNYKKNNVIIKMMYFHFFFFRNRFIIKIHNLFNIEHVLQSQTFFTGNNRPQSFFLHSRPFFGGATAYFFNLFTWWVIKKNTACM